MAKKVDNKGLDIIENPEVLRKEFGKAEGFIKNNRNLIYSVVGGLLLIAVLVFAYKYYQKTKENEAQEAMFNSVYQFENGALDLALKGTGGNEGLESIADDYSGTKGGKLAALYSGIALIKEGKYDDAIEYLNKFSSNDLIVQGKAYCLIGDAYSEKKDYAEAEKYYEKAANYEPNKFYSPSYLMKLAGVYEVQNKFEDAINTYDKITKNYASSPEAQNAKKYKALLETEIGK